MALGLNVSLPALGSPARPPVPGRGDGPGDPHCRAPPSSPGQRAPLCAQGSVTKPLGARRRGSAPGEPAGRLLPPLALALSPAPRARGDPVGGWCWDRHPSPAALRLPLSHRPNLDLIRK